MEKRGVFLASNSALDFLNTEWPTPSGKEDFFETDQDVFSWLRQAGLASKGVEEVRPTGALLRAARALRFSFAKRCEYLRVGMHIVTIQCA
ncbi:ABATE domain-containing protein [Alloacidobacterium dinghuense]|uniref:ABATE domain-containing protein n=1 Tax=Alloacidobacterium dinghuense TaxID=2763107 RepID=A0A7G8BD09_9BACT|nr:ABATE domain-containing protein [Alloacidobacterium dinghuense]